MNCKSCDAAPHLLYNYGMTVICGMCGNRMMPTTSNLEFLPGKDLPLPQDAEKLQQFKESIMKNTNTSEEQNDVDKSTSPPPLFFDTPEGRKSEQGYISKIGRSSRIDELSEYIRTLLKREEENKQKIRDLVNQNHDLEGLVHRSAFPENKTKVVVSTNTAAALQEEKNKNKLLNDKITELLEFIQKGVKTTLEQQYQESTARRQFANADVIDEARKVAQSIPQLIRMLKAVGAAPYPFITVSQTSRELIQQCEEDVKSLL